MHSCGIGVFLSRLAKYPKWWGHSAGSSSLFDNVWVYTSHFSCLCLPENAFRMFLSNEIELLSCHALYFVLYHILIYQLFRISTHVWNKKIYGTGPSPQINQKSAHLPNLEVIWIDYVFFPYFSVSLSHRYSSLLFIVFFPIFTCPCEALVEGVWILDERDHNQNVWPGHINLESSRR